MRSSISIVETTPIRAGPCTISRDARTYLMSRLGADPGLARSEVAKLATYAGQGNEIGPEDIEWDAEGLKRHGHREAWEIAHRLCP